MIKKYKSSRFMLTSVLRVTIIDDLLHKTGGINIA